MLQRLGPRLLLALLAAHLVLGVVRLPGRVWAQRVEEVGQYRELGAARFLLDRAKIGGADVIEWLLANTAADSVVLWRPPHDGALEFASALLAPRLLVLDGEVPAGATTFVGRHIAQGTVPSGERGLIIVQGTDGGGLRLTVRPR
jgi:hypothetical protein